MTASSGLPTFSELELSESGTSIELLPNTTGDDRVPHADVVICAVNVTGVFVIQKEAQKLRCFLCEIDC